MNNTNNNIENNLNNNSSSNSINGQINQANNIFGNNFQEQRSLIFDDEVSSTIQNDYANNVNNDNNNESAVSQNSTNNNIENSNTLAQEVKTEDINNTGNNNFNISDNNKKKKHSFIKILVVIVILAGLGGLGILGFNFVKTSNVFYDGDTISSNTIKQYNLKSVAKWGDIALNISYLMPEAASSFSANGSHSFSYLHGHCFDYNNGLYIYIEKSLEGSKDLDQLFLDIYKEKLSEKYKYEFNNTGAIDDLSIESNKNVKIGNIETTYFETNGFKNDSYSGENILSKFLGYSLNYNDQYISVYGEIVYEGEEELLSFKNDLLKRLQYIIASIEKYDGKSFYEMDKNFNIKPFYDNIAKEEIEDNKVLMFNTYGTHNLNGNYKSSKNYLIKLDSSKMDWDGTLNGIYDALFSPKMYVDSFGDNSLYLRYELYITKWEKQGIKYVNAAGSEIVRESDVKINGIDMKKYVVKTTTYKDTYQVIYTFMLNNNPYVTQFQYDFDDTDKLTEEQLDVFIKSSEVVADTLIRTIRTIENTEQNKIYTDLYFYEY